VVGCSLFVQFNDAPGYCEGGACADATLVDVDRDAAVPDRKPPRDAGDEADAPPSCHKKPDGSVCGTSDPCNDPPTCVAGACTPNPKADGTPCGLPKDVCHSIPSCTKGVCGTSTALMDGTQWKPGDDNARCCGGAPVETTSVDNCGVCGIKCNTKLGQSCQNINNNHYFCAPCGPDTDCWSNCCSLTIASHCSPSNCSTGVCNVPDLCPDGAHCQADTINYCSY
jgi:hypothetical protein